MTHPSRRRVLQHALLAASAALIGHAGAQGEGEVRVIEVTAHRFAYEPSNIAIKAGERVVIAFKSLDFAHGMNIPELGLRLDLVPGQVVRLALEPMAAGVIDFHCDNFCGEGHEDMQGRLVISA